MRRCSPARASRRASTPRAAELPTREQLLEALAQQADIKGKRDLAKVFGIRGDMRRPFKAMLAELEGEGVITRTRKALPQPALPLDRTCAECGHVHAGMNLGSICIGCPCPNRPGVRP